MDAIKQAMDIRLAQLRAQFPTLEWEIAGSYRRGEAQSNDIDLLVKGVPNLNLQQVIVALGDLVVANLAFGPTKFMGIMRLPGKDARGKLLHQAHRIDVRLIAEESYAYALLYFTGSQRFNILMRQQAIAKHSRLNEYALTSGNMSYPADTEADVFQILGLQYLAPNERTKNLAYIPLL